MKTHEIPEAFILKAYDSACVQWKTKIKGIAPAAFGMIDKPKPYTWYMDTRPNNIRVIVTNCTGVISAATGRGANGVWVTNESISGKFENLHLEPVTDLDALGRTLVMDWLNKWEEDYPNICMEVRTTIDGNYLFSFEDNRVELKIVGGMFITVFHPRLGLAEPPIVMDVEEIFRKFNVIVNQKEDVG
jgi:hypothetical protein